MNRHALARDAIDTDIEKTTDRRTQQKNKNPHIYLWFSVISCQSRDADVIMDNLWKYTKPPEIVTRPLLTNN